MQTLIIGDLHFHNKPRGLLAAQKQSVLEICKENPTCDKVIFLGDLMMHRNPRPTVLLALKELFDEVSKTKKIFILRGNHDSINKADDGTTALSLFQSSKVKVITHTWIDHENKWIFIPHYEDEEKIKRELLNAPRGYIVFGHFGYYGVLNSAGDADFSLSLSDFRNPTILGHIHKEGKKESVSVIGTPYSTNFGEAGKDCYYGLLDESGMDKVPNQRGPRHLVIDYDKVEENIDWINDDGNHTYFTLLRININTIDEDQDRIADLCDSLQVGSIEVKYKPLLDDKEEFETDGRVFTTALNDELIDHYINSSKTKINKEDLLSGLKLIHENQQDRNQ
jgi:DNA repair exonuclease SbcCD nuclease subunit